MSQMSLDFTHHIWCSDSDKSALVSQESPKRVTGSVASAHSSASDAVRRDLRRTYQNAPPATAPSICRTSRRSGEIAREWGSELFWDLFVPSTPTGSVMAENFGLSYPRHLADPNTPNPNYQLKDCRSRWPGSGRRSCHRRPTWPRWTRT